MESNFDVILDWNVPNHTPDLLLPVRLTIVCGSDVLTKYRIRAHAVVEDAASHIDFIEIDAFHLLDWLLDAYFYIIYQGKLEHDMAGDNYDYFHNINMINHGFIWPNINFYSYNNIIVIENTKVKDLGARLIEFVTADSEYRIRTADFISSINNTIECILSRAREQQIEYHDYAERWVQVQNHHQEYKDFVTSAVALGYNIFSEKDLSQANEVLTQVQQQLADDTLVYELCLLNPNPEQALQAAKRLTHNLEDIRNAGAFMPSGELSQIFERILSEAKSHGAAFSYRHGYNIAENFWYAVNKDKYELKPAANLTDYLLHYFPDIEHLTQIRNLDAVGLQCVSILSDTKLHFSFDKELREDNAKFKFWVIWFVSMYKRAVEKEKDKVVFLSKYSNSGIYQAAKAFSAEMLVPSSWLEAQLQERNVPTTELISRLAAEYQLPIMTLQHQVDNRMRASWLAD